MCEIGISGGAMLWPGDDGDPKTRRIRMGNMLEQVCVCVQGNGFCDDGDRWVW